MNEVPVDLFSNGTQRRTGQAHLCGSPNALGLALCSLPAGQSEGMEHLAQIGASEHRSTALILTLCSCPDRTLNSCPPSRRTGPQTRAQSSNPARDTPPAEQKERSTSVQAHAVPRPVESLRLAQKTHRLARPLSAEPQIPPPSVKLSTCVRA